VEAWPLTGDRVEMREHLFKEDTEVPALGSGGGRRARVGRAGGEPGVGEGSLNPLTFKQVL